MTKETNSGRICGMDLYRVLSMLMVLILHILGRGGIIGASLPGTPQYFVSDFFYTAAYCAVNCFALASGYLLYERKIRYRKLALLWLTVEFYNVLFFILDICFTGSDVGVEELKTLFPIIINKYWYFTAYFALFLFLPFVNKLISVLSKRAHYSLLAIGGLLFSVVDIIMYFDYFSTNEGYSVWWLMYLYFLGAAVRKYGIGRNMTSLKAFCMFLISVLAAYAFQVGRGISLVKDIGIFYSIFDIAAPRARSYISPFIVGAAFFLLIMCLKLKISPKIATVLAFTQPYVFQVYIIHSNRLIWNFMEERFSFAAENVYLLPLILLLITVLAFTVLIAADVVRGFLFKALKVDKCLDYISDALTEKFENSRFKRNFLSFFEKNIGI